MKIDILWNSLPLNEWEEKFRTVKHSNILQSYAYAQACAKTYGQKAQWGLIKIDEKEAGLVQIIESKILFGAIHGLIMDRGPLWFEGFGNAVHIKLFFDALNAKFPRRWGRKRRVLPEIEQGGAVEQIIRQTGFEKKPEIHGYQTLWWDLQQEEEIARAGLKSNWRGSLKKAESRAQEGDLEITWDVEKKTYTTFKQHYVMDKLVKEYTGISPKLLNNLALFSTQASPMIIGNISVSGEIIAGVLFLTHGKCATYQIGWSSDKGRQVNAHHLLLWQARDILIQHGVRYLDLGGINDQDKKSKGLSSFKRGTGAKPVTLAGHYF